MNPGPKPNRFVMKLHTTLLLSLALGACNGMPETGAAGVHPVRPVRPVATYSIVARDARTGDLGVAVQSHWFDVGGMVPWAEAGVGAVATQSLVDTSYGPLGLDLMRGGKDAAQALRALLAADPGRAVRQIAMIDAAGEVSAHTGENCIAHAGHLTRRLSDRTVVSAQANIMRTDGVPEAMLAAMEKHYSLALPQRLLCALQAAEAVGGDLRGRQSAAILVVSGKPTGRAWEDRLVDLSVPDHEEPLKELERLLILQRAYEHMNRGDKALETNDIDAALGQYKAAQILHDSPEMAFWTAVTLVGNDRVREARAFFAKAFEDQRGDWRELLRRLPAAGLFPDDPKLLAATLAIGE